MSVLQESVFRQQRRDLRDKLRGKCPAGERDRFDHLDLVGVGAFARARQRDDPFLPEVSVTRRSIL